MTLPIALRLSCSLAVARAALGQQAESTTPYPDQRELSEETTADASGGTISFGGGYLDPSDSAVCPSPCSVYLAGSKASDAKVCQKQGSGVGTPQENAELGVACYPPYGCGRDMIPCVNQDWSGAVPDTFDAAAACAGIDDLVAENPWTCEGFEASPTACSHGTPNNDQGKWLKGNADLMGGWGANAVAAGAPTRIWYSGTSSNYECCLKAMMHENSTWDQGGAALRFQYNSAAAAGEECIVDTEWLIYTNMDASSGYAFKYADASGEIGDTEYFYRHGTGAADAANMHTGGRCVIKGGFNRAENPAATGVNKPWGELPDGAEMPNFDCGAGDGSDLWMREEACDATVRVNTINDPEACCELCRTLDLVGTKGGNVSQTDGVHDNPCVAWQIVQGKCRIVRRAYFDYWNAGGPYSSNPSVANKAFTTIQEGIMDDSSWAPGNTDWLISGRGCTTDAEGDKDPNVWCNYFSYIYYRELGTDPSALSDANATFRKIATVNLSLGSENLTIELSADSIGSRRDSTENTSEDCGSVEIYEQAACSDATSGYTVVTEAGLAACTPLCSSSCVVDGQVTLFCQNLAGQIASRRLARGERRLTSGEGLPLLISFNSQGSGYDQVNFGMSATYDVGDGDDQSSSGDGQSSDGDGQSGDNSNGDDQNSAETSSSTTTSAAQIPVGTDTSSSGSCPRLIATALVSLAAFAAASSACQ